MPSPATSSDVDLPAVPWWRVGLVWLVIGGPLTVVIAGFVTLALALGNPDPVLPLKPAAAQPDPTTTKNSALVPAQQARNSLTTPQP